MAMVSYATLTEINGKKGGEIYRHDNCGQHIQKYPRLVKKWGSPSQTKIQNAFSQLWFHWWKKYTNEYQHQMWWIYSRLRPQKNKKGEPTYLTGFNMFVKINLPRLIKDLPPYLDPPW